MPLQQDMVMSSATEISSCGDSIPSRATSSTISGSTMKLLTSQLKPSMDRTMPRAQVIIAFTTAAKMGQPSASLRGLASGSGSAV